MGDMADYLLEMSMDGYEECRGGDVGLFCRHRVSCRYCGESDLRWCNTEDGWRLFDISGKHHCMKQQKAEL